LRVGGNVKPANLVRQTKPTYPENLRAAGVEGKVILEGVIGVNGDLVSVRVMNTDAHPDLAQAAIDAVRQWGYSPTLLNGVPVEVVTGITVEFQLED
jgi:protein TonB